MLRKIIHTQREMKAWFASVENKDHQIIDLEEASEVYWSSVNTSQRKKLERGRASY